MAKLNKVQFNGKEFAIDETEKTIVSVTHFNELMHPVTFNMSDGEKIEVYANQENLEKIKRWLLNA